VDKTMPRFFVALFIAVFCASNPSSAQDPSVNAAPEAITPGEPVPRLIGPVTTVPSGRTATAEAATPNQYPLSRLPPDHLTFYGTRRYEPLYELTRKPPPTDPITGWPIEGVGLPYAWVGGPYYPAGYGLYRSNYRPWYVPYGYGYGWGYRYPFAYSPGYRGYGLYRPWYTYSLYRPWYTYPAPYWSPLYNGDYDSGYGAAVFDDEIVADPPYAGCFFW
jgi:hypothetical protein